MNPFQKVYDAIKNWKTPSWLKVILQEVQNILVQIALQVGKEYITELQNKIVEVSGQNISNEKKFDIVFTYGKTLLPTIKDSYLNLLIEIIFSKLKRARVV